MSFTSHATSRVTMNITFVRHGQTEYNVKRLIQGQRGGDLTECGIQQAYALGRRLTKGVGKEWSFDLLVVSDLHRTRQTAGALLDSGVKVGYVLDSRLREKACGVLEGLPLGASERLARETMGISSTAEAKESHSHRHSVGKRIIGKSKTTAKGTVKSKIDHHMVRAFRPEGGENWLDVNDRAADFVQSLVFRFPEFLARKREWCGSEEMESAKDDGERKGRKTRSSSRRLTFHVLVVTHGGWIKEMKNFIEHKDTNPNNLRNTSLTTLRIGNIPAKYFRCVVDGGVESVESVDAVNCHDISAKDDKEARRAWNECSRSFVLMNDASHIRDLDGFPVSVVPIPIPPPTVALTRMEEEGDDDDVDDDIDDDGDHGHGHEKKGECKSVVSDGDECIGKGTILVRRDMNGGREMELQEKEGDVVEGKRMALKQKKKGVKSVE